MLLLPRQRWPSNARTQSRSLPRRRPTKPRTSQSARSSCCVTSQRSISGRSARAEAQLDAARSEDLVVHERHANPRAEDEKQRLAGVVDDGHLGVLVARAEYYELADHAYMLAALRRVLDRAERGEIREFSPRLAAAPALARLAGLVQDEIVGLLAVERNGAVEMERPLRALGAELVVERRLGGGRRINDGVRRHPHHDAERRALERDRAAVEREALAILFDPPLPGVASRLAGFRAHGPAQPLGKFRVARARRCVKRRTAGLAQREQVGAFREQQLDHRTLPGRRCGRERRLDAALAVDLRARGEQAVRELKVAAIGRGTERPLEHAHRRI